MATMTYDDRVKLDGLFAALGYATEAFGPRAPIRQLRLFCSLVNDPVPPRTVQELSGDIGAPINTVWADMQRFGHTDRHGAAGLELVAAIPTRYALHTTFVINRAGLAVADRLVGFLAPVSEGSLSQTLT